MKSKIKIQRPIGLQPFVVGALATAGSSVASGATVQISFANSVVSSADGLGNFSLDLTGDGDPDVLCTTGTHYYGGGKRGVHASVKTLANGQIGRAGVIRCGKGGRSHCAIVSFGGVRQGIERGPVEATGLIAFTFSDTRINGGAVTAGFLELEGQGYTVGGTGAPLGSGLVGIHRLIFDDSNPAAPTGLAYTDAAYPEFTISAVPEPASNLALLALGAGGLVMRRRLKGAA